MKSFFLLMAIISIATHSVVMGQIDESRKVSVIPEFETINKFDAYLDKLDEKSIAIAYTQTESHFVIVRYRPGWVAVCGHPRKKGIPRISLFPDLEPTTQILDWSKRDKDNEMDFSVLHIQGNSGQYYYFGRWYPLPQRGVKEDVELLKEITIHFESKKVKSIELEDFLADASQIKVLINKKNQPTK